MSFFKEISSVSTAAKSAAEDLKNSAPVDGSKTYWAIATKSRDLSPVSKDALPVNAIQALGDGSRLNFVWYKSDGSTFNVKSSELKKYTAKAIRQDLDFFDYVYVYIVEQEKDGSLDVKYTYIVPGTALLWMAPVVDSKPNARGIIGDIAIVVALILIIILIVSLVRK
jgi:hypothetical protein